MPKLSAKPLDSVAVSRAALISNKFNSMPAKHQSVTDVTAPMAHFCHPRLRRFAGASEELSNENGANGNRVGNRVLDRAHFQQSGICIRYAAILPVHDLETRAIHLR